MMDTAKNIYNTSSNKLFVIFKAITILFIVCLVCLAVVSYIKDNIKIDSRNPFFNHFFDNLKFEFDLPTWMYFLFWVYTFSVVAIPIYLLIFCFAYDKYFNTFLSSKIVLAFFYFSLILFFVLNVFIAYSSVVDHFFTTNNNSVVDTVVDFLYPETASEKELHFYNKVEAVLFSIIAICSVYFLIAFYNYQQLNRSKTMVENE